MLIEMQVNLDVACADHAPPLYHAVRLGRLDVVTALLEGGANVSLCCEYIGNMPSGGNHHLLEDRRALSCVVSLMCHAAVKGNLMAVSHLVDAGFEGSCDANGNTALHHAAVDRKYADKGIQTLLREGADVSRRNSDSNTPLHSAALGGTDLAVKALLEGGADANCRNSKEETPLHLIFQPTPTFNFWAATRIAKLLLEAGADPAARDAINQDTPLHVAARRGDEPQLVHRLTSPLDTVWSLNASEETPLLLAAKNRNLEGLEYLLRTAVLSLHHKHGWDAPIDYIDKFGFLLPFLSEYDVTLHAVAPEGHYCTALLLMADGANVASRNTKGETPLHLGTKCSEIVEALLKAGADPNARESINQETPLHYATRCDGGCVWLLLRAGADPNCRNTNQETPLHVSAENCKNVSEFLEFGVDFEIRQKDGQTALHYAARVGVSWVMDPLLEAGASLYASDDEGRTPLHVAAENGQADNVRQLLDAGADTSSVTIAEKTALDLAKARRHSNVVAVFEERL